MRKWMFSPLIMKIYSAEEQMGTYLWWTRLKKSKRQVRKNWLKKFKSQFPLKAFKLPQQSYQLKKMRILTELMENGFKWLISALPIQKAAKVKSIETNWEINYCHNNKFWEKTIGKGYSKKPNT